MKLTDGQILALWAGADSSRPVLGKKKVLAFAREVEAAVREQGVRVGHLQISRHQAAGIWLRHDNGEGMQTDEDKLYQHLSEYWHKEF